MKKVVALYFAIFTTYTLSLATSSSDGLDFRRRFGPDSAVYNEPLYFNSQEQTSPQDKRPKRSVRAQIRERMNNKSKEQKKRKHDQTAKHNPNLFDR